MERWRRSGRGGRGRCWGVLTVAVELTCPCCCGVTMDTPRCISRQARPSWSAALQDGRLGSTSCRCTVQRNGRPALAEQCDTHHPGLAWMALPLPGHPGRGPFTQPRPLWLGGHGDTIPNGGAGRKDCLKGGTGSCCRLDASFDAAVQSCSGIPRPAAQRSHEHGLCVSERRNPWRDASASSSLVSEPPAQRSALGLSAPPLALSSVPIGSKSLLREETLSPDFYLFQTSAQEGL